MKSKRTRARRSTRLAVVRGLLAPALVAGAVFGAVWAGACETMEGFKRDVARVEPSARNVEGPPASFQGEPDIRVRVAAGQREVAVAGPRGVVVRASKAMKGEVIPTPFTITSSREGLTLTPGSGQARTYPFGDTVELIPSDAPAGADGAEMAPGGPISVNASRYPGVITLRPRWNEDPALIDVVASMGVETYLPGVLTGELLRGWRRQAYEAQSVASRTYALHERFRARRDGRPWDVESTDFDQVFAATTTTVAVEAARATRGRVLTHDGRLIRAYYSSTCGGRASSASAVWPTGPGYEFNQSPVLQGRPRGHYCQRATLYRWEVTRTDDDVSRRLRSWGKAQKHDVQNLTRLREVKVRELNDAGRPIRFTLTDDRGRTYNLTAEEFRVGCNAAAPGLPAITRETRVNSGDLEVEVWADQVRIRGRGWGHGVGLCQWCAQGMAEAGQDWAGMLREFYPGAQVVKAY